MLEQANEWLRPVAFGGLLALALSACGESESNNNSSGSGGTSAGGAGGTNSTTASGGAGGTGGAGGSTTAGGGSGGSGGADGTSTTTAGPASMMCGDTLCEGKSVEILDVQTDACCPDDPSVDPCGIKTDFLEEFNVDFERECQPLNSPGELDENCPDSPNLMPNDVISLPGFPGCCLPSGKCGFMLDEALFGEVQLDLGCIDSRELPNPDFDDPPDCDPVGGAAGAGGAP